MNFRNYYIPNVTETTSRGERTYDLFSRLLKENIISSAPRSTTPSRTLCAPS